MALWQLFERIAIITHCCSMHIRWSNPCLTGLSCINERGVAQLPSPTYIFGYWPTCMLKSWVLPLFVVGNIASLDGNVTLDYQGYPALQIKSQYLMGGSN